MYQLDFHLRSRSSLCYNEPSAALASSFALEKDQTTKSCTGQTHKKPPKEHRNAFFQSWESDVWIRTAPKPLSLHAGTCTMLWKTAHPRRPSEWQGEGRQDSTGGSPSRQMAMRITVGCHPLCWGQQRYPVFMARGVRGHGWPSKPRLPLLREMTNDCLPSSFISAQMRNVSPIRKERAPRPAAVECNH